MSDQDITTKFRLAGTPAQVAAQVAFVRRTLAKWGSPEGRARAERARDEIKAGKHTAPGEP